MSTATEITWTPRDSKSELNPLFENAPFAMAQCQRSGNIIALNSMLERMLRNTSGIVRFGDLIPPDGRADAERMLAELFARQRDSFQIDSHTAGATGRSVRWTAWRVPGTNGNPDSALVWAEDSPRDLDAEQRLRQAERLEAVGRLAGGVAHDFNNLLTGVLLYCDLLMAHLEPCHRVRKYAEEIRKAGMQATGLVRQLLVVARPTNSEPRPLSLNEIADGMRNLLARLIGENIELKFQLDPNLGLIRMDPTQCQQILLNLVLNARDAMPGGGHITVETSNCKVQVLAETTPATGRAAVLPCALFVVADNGSGMDDATRSRLFEAFFTTKAGEGTGLGLATVHDIVTSNGGLIHVESAPACGARVSVLLPLVPEAVLRSSEFQNFCPETNREVLIHNA
jgi:two-component system, cell cycle sensor histidine kinase and response regulator CckA